MTDAIQRIPINYTPYGLVQTEYWLLGNAQPLTFDTLIAEVSIHRSMMLERSIAAQVTALEQRSEKVERLGWAVSILSEVLRAQDGKDIKTSTTLYHDAFGEIVEILHYYDLPNVDTFEYDAEEGSYGIAYGDLQIVYEETAYASEAENTVLQRDLVDLQSLISKRDQSFEKAATLSDKVRHTASVTLKNL